MKLTRLLGASTIFLALCASASFAQVQRTFASAAGSDSNPCSRTAPCRTLAQAISQTNSGGELVVLDSAGYGPVTITKSISIVAPLGVYAGISVFSGDGVHINAGASDTVILRGLTVNSQGSNGGGILLNTGGTLRVESCSVRGFTNGGAGIISLAAGSLLVKDTVISDCDTGIEIQAAGGIGSVHATIDHITVDGGGTGVEVFASGGPVLAMIRDSSISGTSPTGVGIITFAEGGTALLDVERCAITNGGTGIQSSQDTGTSAMSISNCVITHNSFAGFIISGGATIFSRGNNTIGGNGPNTGSLTPSPGQ